MDTPSVLRATPLPGLTLGTSTNAGLLRPSVSSTPCLGHPNSTSVLIPSAGHSSSGSKETGGVKPGAFVRQVLSMMCSLSGTWDLAARHPEVRRIILDQSCEPLAGSLQLGVALYLGPRIRIMGPQLRIEPQSNSWRWLMEMAFPPFAFLLVLDSNLADSGMGLMMTDWVQHDAGEEKKFEGLFEVGFGWTPYPAITDLRLRLRPGEHRPYEA